MPQIYGVTGPVRAAGTAFLATVKALGYRLGSDCGSPNQGSTLFSKRVRTQIRSPVRVST